MGWLDKTDKSGGAAMRKVLLLVAILSLGGCGYQTAAEWRADGVSRNWQAGPRILDSCMRTVYESDRFAPLRPHLPYDPAQASLAQMTNKKIATDEEIRTLFTVHPSIQECRQYYLNHTASATPTLVPPLATQYAKWDADVVQLIQKKLSWGQFATQQRTTAVEAQAQVAVEMQRVSAGLQSALDAEAAQRRAAAALAGYAAQQQLMNNRMRTTTCTTTSGVVRCVTQ